MAEKPWWIKDGKFEVATFDDPDSPAFGTIAIRVKSSDRGFQHVIEFDFADFPGATDDEGRTNAVKMADWVCGCLNRAAL